KTQSSAQRVPAACRSEQHQDQPREPARAWATPACKRAKLRRSTARWGGTRSFGVRFTPAGDSNPLALGRRRADFDRVWPQRNRNVPTGAFLANLLGTYAPEPDRAPWPEQ